METLILGNDAGPDTLRRTIQRNRIKPIQPPVMGNIDASKYRYVSDQGDLLLKDDDNMIIVASRSLLNHIFVVLNLVNLFGDGRFKQIPKKSKERALRNFEIQAIDAIKSTLGVEVLGYEMKCHFHYAQCINCRANALHFGKVLKESATVGTFFRRLQMLPFMPPHLVALSSALEPPRTPVVDV
uniref:Uncharacterized protein n=1 Tax=Heterorhabditis bacteriophora TaxID=37862 RepID=A0A1I7WMU9_HETBA